MKQNFLSIAFLNQLLSKLDKGCFYRSTISVFYKFIAFLLAISPIVILVKAFNIFEYIDGSTIFVILLMWLFAAFGIEIAAYVWWKRSFDETLVKTDSSRFIALPLIANIVKVCGESLGLFLIVGGTLVALTTALFASSQGILSYFITNMGWSGVIICPIAGFLTMLFTKYCAELIEVAASIANDVKKLADEMPKNIVTAVDVDIDDTPTEDNTEE